MISKSNQIFAARSLKLEDWDMLHDHWSIDLLNFDRSNGRYANDTRPMQIFAARSLKLEDWDMCMPALVKFYR